MGNKGFMIVFKELKNVNISLLFYIVVIFFNLDDIIKTWLLVCFDTVLAD